MDSNAVENGRTSFNSVSNEKSAASSTPGWSPPSRFRDVSRARSSLVAMLPLTSSSTATLAGLGSDQTPISGVRRPASSSSKSPHGEIRHQLALSVANHGGQRHALDARFEQRCGRLLRGHPCGRHKHDDKTDGSGSVTHPQHSRYAQQGLCQPEQPAKPTNS